MGLSCCPELFAVVVASPFFWGGRIGFVCFVLFFYQFNLTLGRVIRGEVEKMLPSSGLQASLGSIVLINDTCRRTQLSVGSATTGR